MGMSLFASRENFRLWSRRCIKRTNRVFKGYAERTIYRQYRDTTDREKEKERERREEKRERTGKSRDENKRAPELVVPRNIGKRVEPQKNYIELRQAEERN